MGNQRIGACFQSRRELYCIRQFESVASSYASGMHCDSLRQWNNRPPLSVGQHMAIALGKNFFTAA
jgi:hypothetical protein